LADFIDVSKIYRFYIKIVYPLYFEIFANQLSPYENDFQVMGAALDFIAALFLNKYRKE